MFWEKRGGGLTRQPVDPPVGTATMTAVMISNRVDLGVQPSALGCADGLTETAGDETKVNHDDFDHGSVDPDRLRKAQQALVSLISPHASESRPIS